MEAVIKESRKDEIVYKMSAVESLGVILSSLEIDKFSEVHDIIQSVLTQKSEDEDLTSEELSKKHGNLIKLKEVLYEMLGKAWPEHSKATQEKYRDTFVEHCVSCLPNVTRSIQVSMVSALCAFVDKLQLLKEDNLSKKDEDDLGKIVSKIVEALRYSLGEFSPTIKYHYSL